MKTTEKQLAVRIAIGVQRVVEPAVKRPQSPGQSDRGILVCLESIPVDVQKVLAAEIKIELQ